MNHTSTVGSLHSHYSSGRVRSRSRQPVYTSDKRAKFTQRESKKWIRFITVVGYIVFVSMPAVCLSVYYVYIWDPQYLHKFPNEAAVNKSYAMHKTKEPRAARELPEKRQITSSPLLIQPIVPMNNQKQAECLCAQETIKSTIVQPSLANILSTTTVSPPNLASTTTNEISSTTPNSPNSKSNSDYMSSSFSSSSSSSEHLSSSSEFASKSLEVN